MFHSQAYLNPAALLARILLAVLVILIELVGGLMILVGCQARWAAFAIMLLNIPINHLYHPFWAADGQLKAFLKNACIMGGMLLITVHGPGRLALQRD